MIDVMKLAIDGINEQIANGEKAEQGKIGTLRGGNTGMMTERGQIIGSCAAETYLRYKGIKIKRIDYKKELMFAGGRLNEDHWLSALQTSYKGPILCEEEIPTCWHTSQGIKVTGRPDIILCEEREDNMKPITGIELKQCMSVNSAYGIYVDRKPQLKHLMQAAHYMWQLKCPFVLAYTNRNNLDTPGWMDFRPFPRPEEDIENVIDYRYYRSGSLNPKTGKPKKHQLTEAQYKSGEYSKTFAAACKIKPFLVSFNLMIDENDGHLAFQDATINDGPWIKTIVNIPDIIRFYNYIGNMDTENKVPKGALNLDYTGKPLGWKFQAYSDLEELYPTYHEGKDLSQWVEKVKRKSSQS
jgi:hypothetical protein